MRRRSIRGLALTATAALLLAGCGGDQTDDQAQPPPEQTETGTDDPGGEAPEDPAVQTEGLEDPNEDVEDGVYRGNGVVMPVPDGWSLDQQAFAQGVVAAVDEQGTAQMMAQAIDTEAMEAAGQTVDLDTLVDSVRGQIEQEAATDEEVELQGAERAHQLTYLDLPAQQEGGVESSTTIVIAESGDGLVGEFSFGATTDAYDDEIAELLVDEAGFDPDSEPPAMPQQPAPQG